MGMCDVVSDTTEWIDASTSSLYLTESQTFYYSTSHSPTTPCNKQHLL